jgi:hypothetical protein
MKAITQFFRQRTPTTCLAELVYDLSKLVTSQQFVRSFAFNKSLFGNLNFVCVREECDVKLGIVKIWPSLSDIEYRSDRALLLLTSRPSIFART